MLDVFQNEYTRYCYEQKKFAFLSDYARLAIVKEHGGIYLDTDVELLKPLDALISETGYMGFDDNGVISTGLGFACEKGNELVAALLKDYDDIERHSKYACPRCGVIQIDVGDFKEDEIN